MTQQANPFAAMGDSFNALQGAWDQRTLNQAGRAYAGGDARGAANALAEGGMAQEAAELEFRGQQRENLISAEERAAAAERTTMLMQGIQALQGVPYEQRNQVFEQLAPTLGQFMPPEIIQQLRQADKSDQALGAFGTALGAEAERLQLFNTAEGVMGFNARGERVSHTPIAPRQNIPAGYRQTPDGNLEAIPGGPADPRVIGSRAEAGRAPPRSRSSGGGSRPSGGSSAPTAPSRKPWERF